VIADLEAFVQSLGVDTKSAGTDVGYNDFNVDCPYCGYDKHLGIHRETGQLKCWVCDFDGVRPRPSLVHLVALWAAVPLPVARSMLRGVRGTAQPKPAMPHAVTVQWPEWCSKFAHARPEHRRDRDEAYTYLKHRGVTINDIQEHGLRFTPRGREAYAGRVIIPVTLGSMTVNWVGRDYTGNGRPKYKNALTTMTVVQMSSLLWGMDAFVTGGERHLRVCEGVFDAMALGQIAVSVQKSKLSPQQLKLIRAAQPEAVSIIFDPATEVDRYVKARALSAAHDVSAYVTKVKLVELTGGDVADLGPKATLEAERSAPWLRF
jgi:hypothetical protein